MTIIVGNIKTLLAQFENSNWSRWKLILKSTSNTTSTLNTLELALFIRDITTFHAIDATCPHSGGSLELGDIEDSVVYCPYHAFDFNLASGKCQMSEQFSVTVYSLHLDSRDCLILDLADYELIDKIPIIINQSSVRYSQTPQIRVKYDLSYVENVAFDILRTADPQEKVDRTNEAGQKWNQGLLQMNSPDNTVLDIEPPRTDMDVVMVGKTGKRGKGGTEKSRIAILHSLANLEQWAIDLAWDIIARFSSFPAFANNIIRHEFYSDFIKVALEEAKHFHLLKTRLIEMGSYYGALPIHAGLWDSAMITRHDILARLAIVHMVHEARGLDVNPVTISKFGKAGDLESVRILQIIHDDEVGHVAIGHKWFSRFCSTSASSASLENTDANHIDRFHDMVRLYFHGNLKPPFNVGDREKAGLSKDWYLPLSEQSHQ